MQDHEFRLSFNTRKALCVHLGENAGKELADVLTRLADRLEEVERGKVDVIQVVPGANLMARKVRPRKAH
jgi:hypothetical protein